MNAMNRSYILGIAILMIVVYHLFCWVYNPIGRLNVGFVGVDLFLFFSGLGLTYSYEKNTIKEFYKRRVQKIYPPYLIVSILIIGITTTSYRPLSDFIVKTFLQLSTLSYYVRPEESIDWYLNSIFLFYLLFPLFYKLSKKYGMRLYWGTAIVVTAVLASLYAWMHHPVYWKYDCFISRIPIFCLGITFGIRKFDEKRSTKFALWILLFVLPLRHVSTTFSVSFLAPLLIILCSKLATRFPSRKMEYLGKHSLEIYCASLIPYVLMSFIDSVYIKFLVYVVAIPIFSVVFIYTNRLIQSKLNKH